MFLLMTNVRLQKIVDELDITIILWVYSANTKGNHDIIKILNCMWM